MVRFGNLNWNFATESCADSSPLGLSAYRPLRLRALYSLHEHTNQLRSSR